MTVGSGAAGLVIGWLAAQYWGSRGGASAVILMSSALFLLFQGAATVAAGAVAVGTSAACRVLWQARLRHRYGPQ